ncbi:CMGC family protein kinase [Tritrichomonas foetus]|uniref:non-specific serine/threonine protein kinase n=1 Tax=Tritrichomonas foetus TaxID=1144522 RepID=A0A1J4J026_9EUKA|nr:CMGC family protein kinase [Tritrichomonas foetus]|eukprot:OHS93006.1 CMGC family protein kinase [Tritrichomonas foetus]
MAPNFDNQTKRMPLKLEDFEILDPIGTGSFSNVYHAIHKNSGRHVALKKIFWNISPDRIVSEVKFMKTLNRTDNHENIVKILGLFRDFDQSTVVMDYIPHVPFRTFLPTVTGLQIKQYMFGMIEALCFVHSHKIIHRDVKPANFLFNPATGKGCLIDFGLCEFDLHLDSNNIVIPIGDDANDYDLMNPEKCQNRPRMIASRAGTRGFRAPEVLFAAFNQTPKIDVWSAGVIFLSMITQRYPFFKSPDDFTSIIEIAGIVGTEKLKEAAHECGRRVSFPKDIQGHNLKTLCFQLNLFIDELNLDDSAFDLLEKMLEPIPSKRYRADQCLQHPFFAP